MLLIKAVFMYNSAINKKVKASTFNNLISVIRKEIEKGRVSLERDVSNRKIAVMWRIGSYISIHILEHSEKVDYGDFLFDKLAEELNIGKRTLYRTVQFYKEYPEIVSPATQLTWSHYVILLSVKQSVKRKKYEKLIINKNLSKRQLQEIIRKEKLQISSKEHSQLKLLRGRPGVYRLKQIDGVLNLDCGFYTYLERLELSAVKNPENYVEYSNSSNYKSIEPDKFLLYTFKARITEVIDGDTVKALLYRGFGLKVIRTLRLRGIDAPDLQTKQGEKAKEYIQDKVLNLPFVIIKTYCRDIYLRYLTDVFYLPKTKDVYKVAKKGNYLNQELIDEGLAKRYWKW